MTLVDPALIKEACAALGVSDIKEIGTPGGQKAVRHVMRDQDDLVIKVIALTSSAPTTLERAEREVELLKALNSSHVVRVQSDLVILGNPAHGAAWLEEFLDGEDLGALLGPKWNWHETADMAYQVADGLAVGHDAGVIHRDLSPNNVRCLSNGLYKVMDFGFARHTLRTGITVAGQPGTPGFLSPEHLNAYSGVPMPASDVFGVGILMYAALCAELPVPYNGDDADYIQRLGRLDIADIGTKRPDLTGPQLAIVRRALHPQPARRFLNGRRLAEMLEPLK